MSKGFGWDTSKEALEWFDPLSPFRFLWKPSPESFAKMVVAPAIMFGTGYATTRLLDPGAMYNPAVHTANKVANTWNLMKMGTRLTIRAVPTLAALATVYVGWRELNKTVHQNLGMEPVTGVHGAYSHPLSGGGSDDIYYPGKGIVDYFLGD
jgi:hypothetical protein